MYNEKKEIHLLIQERITAVKNKDVPKATADYSKDVILYDVVDPLQYLGIDALRKRLEEWFSSLSKIIDFDIKDIEIKISEDIAYCCSLNHIHAINLSGNKLDMWWRETTCYSRTNGKWTITHAHSSVPFNPLNGKASLDLKPVNNGGK